MFCRDLLPRLLVNPRAAAALSLTCKWMYNAVAPPLVSFRYDGAYYICSDFYSEQVMFADGLREYEPYDASVVFNWHSYWGAVRWFAKFVVSGVYHYTGTTDKLTADAGIRIITVNTLVSVSSFVGVSMCKSKGKKIPQIHAIAAARGRFGGPPGRNCLHFDRVAPRFAAARANFGAIL